MKLSPPASSSDLETARGIARRLARLALPGEPRPAPMPVFAPHAGARAAEPPPPRVAEPPVPHARPAAAPAPLRAPASEPRMPAPAPGSRKPVPEAPPALRAPAPPRSAPPAPPPAPARKLAPPPSPPPSLPTAAEQLGFLAEEEPLGVRTDDEPLGVIEDAERPSARRREAESESEIELEPEAQESPIVASGSEEIEFDEPEGGKGVPELELVTDFDEEKPTTPSWADILQDCLFLARAKGALLIGTEGTVTASCGDWPPPGVDAIGARLVPAMEKALKNAPGRSVSVPLGVLHLTAWRVPLPSGVVTVGFVADAPLKAEVRPTIDAELRRGEPA